MSASEMVLKFIELHYVAETDPGFGERRFWRPVSLDTGWHIVDM